MTPSEKYPIERNIFTLNDCYKANKRRKPTGIQVHSVGCKGTTRNRWKSWNVGGLKKCANAFIDLDGIMQTLDWDVRPWLSGSGTKGNANDTCVGFEICEPSTSKDTPEAAAYLYGCVMYLCTELCRDYGIHPSEIKCHCELHKEGRASNHADVNHWWGKKGTSWEPYTMTRLRHDVAEALGIDLMEGVDMITMMLKKGMTGEAVRAMQEMLNDIGYDCGTADGIYGTRTQAAVVAFQRANSLTADGIAGPQTLSVLAARAAAPSQPVEPEDSDDEAAYPDKFPAQDETPEDVVAIPRNDLAIMRRRLSDVIANIDEILGA